MTSEKFKQSLVSKIDFREAMSCLGAAVHIVTTDGLAGKCGITVSAVCSVSDDPPTILVCLNRSSEMNHVFKKNGNFCLNTLQSDQQEISDIFAGIGNIAMQQRFELFEFETHSTGAPLLQNSLVSLDCQIASVSEVGTHSVMFGQVCGIKNNEGNSPLMYFRRSYRSL